MLLLATLLIAPAACKAPAEFEVTSVNITPPEVTAGNAVTVTAEVKNTGGSQGVYTAILSVDGVEIETKDVAVASGISERVTFSLVKHEDGTYTIAVGEVSSSLTVNPELSASEHLKQGEAHTDQGQWDEAIAEYSKAIELAPEVAKGYYSRGIAYDNKTQWDLAIADFNKAIELLDDAGLIKVAKQKIKELRGE